MAVFFFFYEFSSDLGSERKQRPTSMELAKGNGVVLVSVVLTEDPRE